MATVTLKLPGILRDVAGASEFRLEAATLAGAIEKAYVLVPALRFHLCREDGEFRPHVLCLHNGVSTRDLKSLRVPLRDGDQIAIVQAISGG